MLARLTGWFQFCYIGIWNQGMLEKNVISYIMSSLSIPSTLLDLAPHTSCPYWLMKYLGWFLWEEEIWNYSDQLKNENHTQPQSSTITNESSWHRLFVHFFIFGNFSFHKLLQPQESSLVELVDNWYSTTPPILNQNFQGEDMGLSF